MKQETKFKKTEIGMIPEDWEVKELRDITKFKYGLGESAQKKGEFVYIRITDINSDGTLNSSNPVYMSREKVTKDYILDSGDVLIARTGATFGKTLFFNKNFKATYGGFLIKFIFDKNKLDNNFFFQFSRSNQYWHQANNLVGGGAQPQFNANTVARILVPFPPLPEQKSIAKILSTLDEKIELLQKQNKTLEEIGQAIFKKWFIDNLEKEGWEVSTIGKELKTILGGTPSRVKPEYWNGDISWINSGSINEFPVMHQTEFITEEGLKNSAAALMPKKTIVLPFVISLNKEIKISILGFESSGNQSVLGIIPNKKFSSAYIYYWIQNIKPDIYSWATGGAQQHVNKGNVDKSELLIPDKKILDKFNKIGQKVFDKILNNSQQIQTLSQIRDSLLPKLISGKIRVPLERGNEII